MMMAARVRTATAMLNASHSQALCALGSRLDMTSTEGLDLVGFDRAAFTHYA